MIFLMITLLTISSTRQRVHNLPVALGVLIFFVKLALMSVSSLKENLKERSFHS